MANPTPLDFESIGADRQAKIKELEGKNTRTLNDRAFNAGASNTFSTLDVKKPTAFDNFTPIPPTGVNQIGIAAPPSADAASPEHFGA
jgi:hypothetical protein